MREAAAMFEQGILRIPGDAGCEGLPEDDAGILQTRLIMQGLKPAGSGLSDTGEPYEQRILEAYLGNKGNHRKKEPQGADGTE
ncbi:MAG: hypothetical protein LBQ30_05745 [Treponema sp.]|jgi:hypothetical protein|nr:hypothetical protein [Treponema sp.]